MNDDNVPRKLFVGRRGISPRRAAGRGRPCRRGPGVGALPGGAAYLGATTIPAAWSVAVSRVYAVGSGVVGAWTADYLFGQVGAGDHHARLWVLGAGAVAGIAAFNLATGPMGVLPMVGATLEPVPMSTVLGSRLIAVTTAGLGAVGGTWVYDRMNGRDTDLVYAFSLLGGAIGGVALTNYLTAGQFGTLPLSVASGMAGAGQTIADATTSAASRIWVVGSGVAGAMAANWPFQRQSAAQAPSAGVAPAARR